MIKFKLYENDPTLMVTYTTEPEVKKLHKVSTDEYYNVEVIDAIKGFYGPEEPDLEGLPYCDYTYEEVDIIKEESEDETEQTD